MKYYLTNLFFASSQIRIAAECTASCQEASPIMHTLLWQHLNIAETVQNNPSYKTHLICWNHTFKYSEKIHKESSGRRVEKYNITKSFTRKDSEMQCMWEYFLKSKKVTRIKTSFCTNLSWSATYFVASEYVLFSSKISGRSMPSHDAWSLCYALQALVRLVSIA